MLNRTASPHKIRMYTTCPITVKPYDRKPYNLITQQPYNPITVKPHNPITAKAMIEIKNLCKSFGDKEVLKDISAVFEGGKTNRIIGQSG